MLKNISKTKKSLNPCFTGICSPTLSKVREWTNDKYVLILVLLEYARRQFVLFPKNPGIYVLILVLLEYARRQSLNQPLEQINYGLNPCFTGICSPTASNWAHLTSVHLS